MLLTMVLGVSCNGSSDGEITFSNVLGGTPNFTYSIDGGTTFSNNLVFNSSTGTPISAGSYSFRFRMEQAV